MGSWSFMSSIVTFTGAKADCEGFPLSAAFTIKSYCALLSKSGEFFISRLPRENNHTYLTLFTSGARRGGRGGRAGEDRWESTGAKSNT